MPGVYHGDDFDAAGFAIGIVDEEKTLGPHRVSVGDRVIGVSSSGFHSNGFSLLRKVFAQDLDQWRETLMAPTHLYASVALELVREGLVNAIANITGGGMENIPRVLPQGTALPLVDWAWPEPFTIVQDRTGMSRVEMLKTLNCGIGLALIVPAAKASAAQNLIERHGYKTFGLGTVERAKDPGAEAEVLY
jgi:phosphoribosylformylglycinamidine cyclo-ligase